MGEFMEKLIITAAPVGAELTRKEYPDLPITPDEIAEEAFRCWNEGASIVHLHARLPDGRPTQRRSIYEEIIGKIRAKCDLIIQVSTGGQVGMTPEERIDSIYTDTDMATLTLGTVNFSEDVFLNSLPMIESFAGALLKKKLKPEIEIFDVGMVYTAFGLLKRKVLKAPLHWSFIMGVPGGVAGRLEELVHLVGLIPKGDTWQVGGVGLSQLPLSMAAILMGGHVRVGAEDNIYFCKGQKIRSSAELVKRTVAISRLAERDVATTQEARKILSLE